MPSTNVPVWVEALQDVNYQFFLLTKKYILSYLVKKRVGMC